ncbi:MAG: hypothetical protein K2J75_00080, partial [Clostridia bacterium]|nr:hypothetical protein [Clostridia bacterium]
QQYKKVIAKNTVGLRPNTDQAQNLGVARFWSDYKRKRPLDCARGDRTYTPSVAYCDTFPSRGRRGYGLDFSITLRFSRNDKMKG